MVGEQSGLLRAQGGGDVAPFLIVKYDAIEGIVEGKVLPMFIR